MQFTDRLTIDRSHRTKDGYLRVVAKAARSGVYQYKGSEIDPAGEHFAANDTVNVYRPSEEVFAPDSMASFIGRPITDDHPSEAVTADNWRRHSRGVVGGAVKDGEWLRFDLALMDADLIAKVDGGKRALSNGYNAELEIGDGTAPDGTKYQAMQRTIRGNHVAVVDKARAGPECRISDGGNALFQNCDAAPVILSALDDADRSKRETNVPKIMLDGLMVDLSDAEAVQAAFKKLEDRAKAAEGKLTEAETALADARKEHDKALGTKDAEIEKLKEQVVDAAKIDALADAKAEVVGKAKAVLGDKLPDTKGKSIADVRRAAVAAKFGDDAVKDRSDDYVEARFDAMTADVKPAEAQVFPIHTPAAVNDSAEKAVKEAYQAMVADLKGEKKADAA